MPTVRPAVLAGTWYPAQPGPLRNHVASYLAMSERSDQPQGKPRIAVVPHAGYRHSGPTAGKLYGLLAGFAYDAVFILAPSHRARLRRAALSSMTAYATPLGEVPVAVDIVQTLAATPYFDIDDGAHAMEHAVEIQLPLLQCALPAGTPIVPILVPHLDRASRLHTAGTLDPWRDARHLFLISSDFTHYGDEYGFVPFTDDVPQRIEQLDTGAILKILAHDSDGLIEYGSATGITMCGLDAAAVVLLGAPPAGYEAALLGYARSADDDPGATMSVSYAAIVLCADDDAVAPGATPGPAAFTPPERAFLLDLARAAVTAAARGHTAPSAASFAAMRGIALGTALQARRGVFVTLNDRGGHLRGCIGTIEGELPVVDAVVDSATGAALADPRFVPLRESELDGTTIEVSILTPTRAVPGPQAIEIGRHGIVLRKGRRKAVFLPHVAPQQGWDLATTLDHLAIKAGLAADGWRNGSEFHVFEAEILGEERD